MENWNKIFFFRVQDIELLEHNMESNDGSWHVVGCLVNLNESILILLQLSK